MHRRSPLAALALAVVLTLSACARVSDQRPAPTSSAPTGPSSGDVAVARQDVTADFGQTAIVVGQQIPSNGTVLDALRATTSVETQFGGGFVSGMYDRRSDASGTRDWFYFVNGLAPGVGANDVELRPGDHVWWEYRRWGGGPSAPAVVGSWPQPFVTGYPGRPDHVQADPPLAEALIRLGARVGETSSPWRVIVGSNADLVARDRAWRRAMADPAAAGVTVRFTDRGIECLDADGRRMQTVPAGRAAAVMVLSGATAESGGAVMAVAGLDAAAARAAADRIARDPQVLAGRYAVVFDGDGQPVAAAGRSTP